MVQSWGWSLRRPFMILCIYTALAEHEQLRSWVAWYGLRDGAWEGHLWFVYLHCISKNADSLQISPANSPSCCQLWTIVRDQLGQCYAAWNFKSTICCGTAKTLTERHCDCEHTNFVEKYINRHPFIHSHLIDERHHLLRVVQFSIGSDHG